MFKLCQLFKPKPKLPVLNKITAMYWLESIRAQTRQSVYNTRMQYDIYRTILYNDLIDFFYHDLTDLKQYLLKSYNCVNFTRDVMRNLKAKFGKDIAVAEITTDINKYDDTNHRQILYFNPENYKNYLIEPQDDKIIVYPASIELISFEACDETESEF